MLEHPLAAHIGRTVPLYQVITPNMGVMQINRAAVRTVLERSKYAFVCDGKVSQACKMIQRRIDKLPD